MGMKVHNNEAFSRNTSGIPDSLVVMPSSKAEAEQTMQPQAVDEADAGKNGKPEAGTAAPPKEIPRTPVGVEVWHMGQHTFRGSQEKVMLCQVFPTSLSNRRHAFLDACIRGKGVCSKKDDSLGLSAQVMLPEVLHLPLSAEPPLCLNVMVPKMPNGAPVGGRHMSMTQQRSAGYVGL